MIADTVARIQAIEQKLTEKTQDHLQTRLAIRSCLKELREISGNRQPTTLAAAKDFQRPRRFSVV
jgi:uncharacterized protein YhaN